MTISGSGGQTAYELSPPPMIGLLPATTVVYILLGMGALLPILLLSVVAVTLCVRRRGRKSSSSAIPVDAAATAADCHSNGAGFDVDADDVFDADDWNDEYRWNATSQRTAVDCGTDYRKRIAEIGGRTQVVSANNPNVYFRNGLPAKLDVSPSDAGTVVRRGRCELSASPSSDVTMTSSSRSDIGGDAVSIGPTSGVVEASTDSRQVATTLDRVPSLTRSTLEQEEERVLRYETFITITIIVIVVIRVVNFLEI